MKIWKPLALFAALTLGTTFSAEACPGDLNGDNKVNTLDLLELLSDLWKEGSYPADFDNDGMVDMDDVLFLVSRVGVNCED